MINTKTVLTICDCYDKGKIKGCEIIFKNNYVKFTIGEDTKEFVETIDDYLYNFLKDL